MDFQSLYQKHAPAVRRFALFLCGDPAMADDITSDTFVRVWLARGRIRELTVKSYLFTIARNAYRDAQRRRWRRALDDMPYEEIAGALQITATTAKVKVHRARVTLMKVRNPVSENLKVSGERL